MASMAATPTGAPTSSQLQFNFKFRKPLAPFLFSGYRVLKPDDLRCRVRVRVNSENDSETERRRSGESSWNKAGVNDWFGDPHQFGDDQKQGIGGIMGAGLASIFLVAGLTFAAVSIGKQRSSRVTPKMEPLTEQHEMPLTLGDEVYKEEDNVNSDNGNAADERNLQTDHYLESKPGELEASIQEDLQPDSTIQEVDNSDSLPTSTTSPELESADGVDTASNFIDSSKTLAVGENEENWKAVGSTVTGTDAERIGICDQQQPLAVNQTDTLHTTTLEPSSSSPFPVSTDDTKLEAAVETQNMSRNDIGDAASVSTQEYTEPNRELDVESDDLINKSVAASQTSQNGFISRGIPAPSLLSAALQAPPGKVLVPAIVDQTQGQALAALQVLKVIESDVQPGDLCTRREYARWLVAASNALSRNSISKVYPAMYIESATELAFDDITPEDPDFTSIQGLAEAGLISSKLSKRDMLSSPEEDIGSLYFHPDSPLSRQDLVTWKMALENRQLPASDRKILHQLSGFIDLDKIDPDAWPALVSDLSAGEQGIVALAFGYTRLFQPDKPVTKGQAAIALATGEASDIVSEELARIEAESIAENAVAAHNALVAEVEKDINATFEKELLMEREKVDEVQKMAEEAKKEVDRLRGVREEENVTLMKERAAVESEMEVLSRLRHELEEQLQSLMSNKVEISYEKERIEKLRKETEEEHQSISRLQYELEVERKALSMARAWAEDEAKRVQEYAKSLEEARDRWDRQGIKVVVDKDLQEEASPGVTWTNVGKKLSAEETVDRAETLMEKLKIMAGEVKGKSKEVMNTIIKKIQLLISVLKEWISEAGRRTTEFRDVAIAKIGGSAKELEQHAAGFGSTMQEGAKRVVGDCRDGVEKLTQRFKT